MRVLGARSTRLGWLGAVVRAGCELVREGGETVWFTRLGETFPAAGGACLVGVDVTVRVGAAAGRAGEAFAGVVVRVGWTVSDRARPEIKGAPTPDAVPAMLLALPVWREAGVGWPGETAEGCGR